ncbi:pyridoxamine 5'-phosphate oxidase family protein [Actinomadura barringtoniae]|uniref:Pyridoxamine 5'-phosphate oxidase family protein n=1 Tax=Actinomadura barringtoniae TaxID=1427535 RepID=A0A939PKA4_9ACTN|nr:pyridoxamine 5'-phosphate oxidase family protein [Actinomadura barringtoniae]MBO2454482.1 pyridoxamine 5'-phosphate oxidase family protein [Actinomadura barringtoniae]
MSDEGLAALAREILDRNLYVTLGTADGEGRPWVSPVYFATADYREIIWVSALDAEHSVNLAVRPEVSMVVFDSTVPTYHGRAVYMSGVAAVLEGTELDRGVGIYPGAPERGASTIEVSDVSGDAPYRLYRATVDELSVLCPREPRQPCPRHSLNKDHRTAVKL